MRYLLAILLPPVAMFTVGKPFQAILCLVLMMTVIGWPIAAIWAILVVNSSFADTRNKKLIAEMQKQTEIQVAAARAAKARTQAQPPVADAEATTRMPTAAPPIPPTDPT